MAKFDGPWYYEMQELGFNYRITDLQCALGVNQLKKLKKFLERRRELISIYNRNLHKIDKVNLPIEKPYVKSAWHIYYVRLKESSKRSLIFKELQKFNIGVQVHYIPVHLQPYYRNRFGYKVGDYLKAEDYYKSTITLPLYPKITNDEIQYVVDILIKEL